MSTGGEGRLAVRIEVSDICVPYLALHGGSAKFLRDLGGDLNQVHLGGNILEFSTWGHHTSLLESI